MKKEEVKKYFDRRILVRYLGNQNNFIHSIFEGKIFEVTKNLEYIHFDRGKYTSKSWFHIDQIEVIANEKAIFQFIPTINNVEDIDNLTPEFEVKKESQFSGFTNSI